MKSLWTDQEAAAYKTDLAQRVYTSRLLGRDKTLVLHGGGNTSVKTTVRNIVGEDEEILYVKGSGWDLEFIEEAGFSPVRMAHLLKLAKLEKLSDPQMVNELVTQMTRASAPAPSVETILHALLPHKFVDHTHADAFISITNTPRGDERLREIYGGRVVYIPYVMPGFKLARLCAELPSAEAVKLEEAPTLPKITHLRALLARPIAKVPALRGRTVTILFYEASTRTRVSFEVAAKNLSADVVNIATAIPLATSPAL